jgi:hypothetical protein
MLNNASTIDDSLHPYGATTNKEPIKINHFLNDKKSDQLSGSFMYQTVSSSNQLVSLNKFKQILKVKLQYEWKNIYRLLSTQDQKGNGTVFLSDFENAIH